MRILKLTLKKQWFDLMKTGEKDFEVRKRSKWIMSRLKNKTYDVVEFTNGYRKDSPKFRAEFKGFIVAEETESFHFRYYCQNVWVDVKPGDVVIRLGKVLN